MPRIQYEDWTPGPDARLTVSRADQLARTYAAQGYDLTLRQLYYQFVSRDWLPNTVQSYKKLGDIVHRGRMAGLLDWRHIVDRTRNLAAWAHSTSPEDEVASLANGYSLDRWPTQPVYVEVWVEKEALAGVVGRAAAATDVPYFSCRGYVSSSEMWAAAQRLGHKIAEGKRCVILHLGDHDPSGIDMTRDIHARLDNFITTDWLTAKGRAHFGSDYGTDGVAVSAIRRSMAAHVATHIGGGRLSNLPAPLEVHRIALNMDQVEEYDPPPNPAKQTDSRFRDYLANYGDESWELDALEPSVLDALIQTHVEDLIEDREAWDDVEATETNHRSLLRLAAQEWPSIVANLTLASPDQDPEDDL